MNQNCRKQKRYAIVTAAYNEEQYIENLIDSVIAQTEKPTTWIIVSDGSTDRTDDIVNNYARSYDFIRLHRITEDHPRNFVAQVHAINSGLRHLEFSEFEFIGNLDSDITLEPGYFAELLARFELDPKLGLAGGYIYEQQNGTFQCRRLNNTSSVAHAIQLFRRECLEQIGGAYVPMPYGGPDWQAEVNARLRGWNVQAFEDLKVYHHRPTGAVAGLLNTAYRQGLMDHSLGTHPCFELFRVIRRLPQRPYLIASTIRLIAFVAASARRESRPVSTEFVKFLRNYEQDRLKKFFITGLLGFYQH